MISFPFLSILVISFSTGAEEKVIYFSVFSPKKVNCPSNYSTNFFMRQ